MIYQTACETLRFRINRGSNLSGGMAQPFLKLNGGVKINGGGANLKIDKWGGGGQTNKRCVQVLTKTKVGTKYKREGTKLGLSLTLN